MSSNPPNQGCTHPSPGWYCSREPGHEGPCAARSVEEPQDSSFEELVEDLIRVSVQRGRDGSTSQGRLINGSYESRQKKVDDARSALLSSYRDMEAQRDGLKKVAYSYIAIGSVEECQYWKEQVASLRLELSEARERQLTRDEALLLYGMPLHPGCAPECEAERDRIIERFLSLPTPTSDVK